MTAVEQLIHDLKTIELSVFNENHCKKYLDLEKQQEKDTLIDFLYWMNIVSAKHPIALETDTDDIVDMYLNKFFK